MDCFDRRHFLHLVPAAGLMCVATRVQAQAPARLDVNEKWARQVGYVEDAGTVDKKKYPKFQVGQDCYSCDLYKGDRAQAWAPCVLFPRRVVAGKGWCDAYVTRRK